MRLEALGTVSAEEDLLEQEDVEGDDHRGQHAGEGGEPARVDQVPHHLALAGDDQQRHQGEGDAEGEDDLAADQGVGRVEPIASTSSAGARVTARRTKSGMRRRMKPCITTWPAIVPTEEEAKPEASRAMPKTVAVGVFAAQGQNPPSG